MKKTNLKCNDMNTNSFEHPAEAVHVSPGGGLLGVEVVYDDGAAQPRPVQGIAESSLHLTRMTQVLLSGLRWRGHCSTAALQQLGDADTHCTVIMGAPSNSAAGAWPT